jgi:hypothetical protein
LILKYFLTKRLDEDFSGDEMNKNKRLKICSTQNEKILDSIYLLNSQQYVMMRLKRKLLKLG